MKGYPIVAVIAIHLISNAYAKPQPQGSSLPSLTNDDFKIRFGMNKFGNDMFRVWLEDTPSNVVISPLSIYLTMAMVLYGSPESSETNQELLNLLGLDPRFYEEYSHNFLATLQRYEPLENLQIANRMYYDQSLNIKSDYATFLELVFRSPGEGLDFKQPSSAVERINAFVEQTTNGKIQDLLSPEDISELIRMILVNAIYFKGNWESRFDRTKTSPEQFSVDRDQTFSLDTMHQQGNFGLADVNGAKILELKYETPNLKMFIVLPNADQDIRSIDIGAIDFALIDKTLSSQSVIIQVPKFKIESKGELKTYLEKLGVSTVFGSRANLSDIADEPLFLSKVIHQALLEVNEEGTEAAAATAAFIDTRVASNTGPTRFIVDRPFYAVIYDSVLEIPLFYARIVDPEGVRSLSSPNTARRSAELTTDLRSSVEASSQPIPLGVAAAIPKECRPNDGDIQFPCQPQK